MKRHEQLGFNFLDIVMKIFLILMNIILLELSLNILVILKPFH